MHISCIQFLLALFIIDNEINSWTVEYFPHIPLGLYHCYPVDLNYDVLYNIYKMCIVYGASGSDLVVACTLCFMTVVRATTTTEAEGRGDNLVQGAATATNFQPDQATPATEAGVAAAAGCAAT